MLGIAPLIGGLLGTVAMTVFLLLPRWLNIGNVDVIRAAGALVTKRTENAFGPGLIIHFGSGILFAYLYTFALYFGKLPVNFLTCGLVGLVHGVIVMLLVSIVVLEHHPIAKYHDRGPMTGIMQLLAHVLYGVILGAVVHGLTS
ncbi:MAG: DUF6789 family protein [Chthoniobacterales bacterium]